MVAEPAYSKDPSLPGGVWKGLKAIIIRVDQSGEIISLGKEGSQFPFKATRPNPQGGGLKELFKVDTAEPWLSGARVLNPLAP